MNKKTLNNSQIFTHSQAKELCLTARRSPHIPFFPWAIQLKRVSMGFQSQPTCKQQISQLRQKYNLKLPPTRWAARVEATRPNPGALWVLRPKKHQPPMIPSSLAHQDMSLDSTATEWHLTILLYLPPFIVVLVSLKKKVQLAITYVQISSKLAF